MDDLGESVLAAEGMVNAQEAQRGNHNTHCLNCGTKLQDVYCHHCGQKDLPRRQTMGELWSNVISSFFSYEGKFLLTARYLITKPGLLAIEFNAGRRERYFHPVRMYAFISFIFFLIFFSIPEKKDKTEMTEEDRAELTRNADEAKQSLVASGLDTAAVMSSLDSITGIKMDSVINKPKRKNRFNYGITKSDYATMESYDSAQALLTDQERDGWITRKLMKRSIELTQKYGDDKAAFGKDFWKATLDNFSKMLFFMLPVFALLLKLLYMRRNYFYSEHLVFSIYYYNFFYFAASIMMLAGLIPGMEWLASLIGWVIYFYLLLAMKRMYGQGWGKTVAKFFVFSFLFMLCSVFGFLINLLVIVMVL